MSPKANINLNLQTTDNYYVVLKSDAKFKSDDVTFEIKNFNVPSMSILSADIDVNQNIIHFPAQGRMDYEELNFDILLDDNINSYIELAKWINRLKDPEKLLQSHLDGYDPSSGDKYNYPLKRVINASNQHLIEYRDLDVYITDRNNQAGFRFNFVDAWISDLSGLEFNAQESEYMSFNATFNYLYMRIYDIKGNQILPQTDRVLHDD